MYIIKKKNKNKIVMFDTLSFRRQRRRRRRLYFFTRTHNRSLTMYISVASSHSYSAHSLSPRTLAICIYRCSRVCRSFIQGVFFSSFLSCLVFFCCWFLLWFYLVSVLSLSVLFRFYDIRWYEWQTVTTLARSAVRKRDADREMGRERMSEKVYMVFVYVSFLCAAAAAHGSNRHPK